MSGEGPDAWEVVAPLGSVRDTSHAPKGTDIHYRCARCGEAIPCHPPDNVGCACGNVFIDIDAFRLAVRDFSLFEAVRNKRG